MKKKVFLVIALIVVALVVLYGPNTNTGTKGLIYATVDNSYVVVGYGGSEIDITIPDTYNDIPVTAVEAYAFEDSQIQSVVFGKNLTQIGEGAFVNASSLQSVTFTAEGIYMETDPFKGCSSLTDIVFVRDAYVASADFSECDALVEVSFPEGLTSLRMCDCNGLTTVELPDGMKSLVGVSGCSSLTSIPLPDSLIEIEESAFVGCSSLNTTAIPASVTYVGEGAFEGFTSNQKIFIEGSTDGWQEATTSNYQSYYGENDGSWDSGCDAQITYLNAN
ncbi:MAG: leucine-rich repeat domain-containing protein [Clostridiales bacterium]|nr:leucine-rich repeat domain-containing protein [Clostridiales bacterium]